MRLSGKIVRRLTFLGFPNYAVSKSGIVWSQNRKASWKRKKHGVNIWGHHHTYLYKNGKGTFFFVHRLVLLAFVGPCPPDRECRHLDGNPHNNKLSNLKWGTKKRNMKDRTDHGRTYRGEKHWNSKLSSADVLRIKKLRQAGSLRIVVASRFGISPTMVSMITSGRVRRNG